MKTRILNVFTAFVLLTALVVTFLQGSELKQTRADLKQERSVSKTFGEESIRQNNLLQAERDINGQLKKELTNVKKVLAETKDKQSRAEASLRRANTSARASRSQRLDAKPRSRVSRTDTRGRSSSGSVASGAGSSVKATGALRDITQYCATGNPTASGKTPRPGMVATLSRSIPFGTRIRIEGLGTFIVEDRIGHGSEFDIYTDSCSAARQFGRQHRRVTILD